LAKELDNLSLTLVSDSPRIYTLRGTPKRISQRLRSIALTVDATGQIHSMRIEEIDGAATTFTFTAMRENIPTAASDFTFTPPLGVTLVDGAAPI